MSKKAIVILLIVLILIGAGAGGYFFILKDNEDPSSESAKLYNYAVKDSFVTNVKDSSRLFKTTIVLVANEDGLDEFFESNKYTIRDTILFIMRDLTENDIRSGDIQERLRILIAQALNESLQIESISSVYFSDFVMQ